MNSITFLLTHIKINKSFQVNRKRGMRMMLRHVGWESPVNLRTKAQIKGPCSATTQKQKSDVMTSVHQFVVQSR